MSPRWTPAGPGWRHLRPLGPVAPLDPATAGATPDDRAAIVKAFVDAAGGLETAGYCRTNHWSGAFANSAGQAVAGESADVGLAGIARRPGSDGVARAASGRLADIDGAVLGARAAAKANAGVDPVELPPDRYEVVLEPTAVADILEAFTVYGFNAKAVAERRSFVRLGDEQFDASRRRSSTTRPAPGSATTPKGTPRRRLVLVDGGTTVALTHDRRTAATAGATSTGHGVGSAAFGAIARHLVLLGADAPGAVAAEVDGPVVDSATAELVAGVERGVLVTDFWYTRVLDPRSLAITGLTRNGVWLIEHGEVTHTAAQLPLHAVLRPGADAGRGASRRSGGLGDARRHVLGEHAALDRARAAPGVVELHRRGERLIRRSGASPAALGWSVGR